MLDGHSAMETNKAGRGEMAGGVGHAVFKNGRKGRSH